MKTPFYACLTLLLIGVCGFSTAAPLILVTENRPPRQMLEDGKLVGTATSRIRKLMDKAGLSYSLDVYPFARAFDMAKSLPNVCVFSIARTPERENQFIWIAPALMQIRRVFLAKDDSHITLKSLDDAKGYRIGTYNGDAMDKYFKSLNWDVDTAPDDVNNLYKLALNRIDLWVDDEQVAYYLIEKNNQKIKIHSVYTIQTLDVYLACNPNTDAEAIAKLMLAAKKL